MAAGQHQHRGGFALRRRKGCRKLGQTTGVRPTKPEHDLIGVADGQNRATRRHQGPQQTDLSRVEFAVFVDDHPRHPRPYRGDQCGVGERDARAVHQFGVVEAAFVVEYVEVLGEEAADARPLGSVGRGAERRHVVGVEAELPHARDRPPHLPRERTGADRLSNVGRPGRRPSSAE